MSLRQLTTTRPTRQLRWTHGAGVSLRAYLSAQDGEPCPCVSTRSAELTVVLDGEVAFEVGPLRQTILARAGEALWVPRGLSHAIFVGRDARAFIVDQRASPGELGLRSLPVRTIPAAVLRAFDRAWRERPERALERIAVASSELVVRLSAREPVAIESVSSTARMLHAKRILEARFQSPPTLAELARAVGTSEFYLLRAFKRHFAFTPYAYAQFLRTEHFFWELLAAPARAIVHLAADAGFGDYSTFHRRMRKMTGRAPSSLVASAGEDVLGPG